MKRITIILYFLILFLVCCGPITTLMVWAHWAPDKITDKRTSSL